MVRLLLQPVVFVSKVSGVRALSHQPSPLFSKFNSKHEANPKALYPTPGAINSIKLIYPSPATVKLNPRC